MTDTEPATISVGHLEATAGDDAGLVDWLARLINDVYAVAERGLWRDGATRTTASELAGLIAAGEIAVATRDGRISGSVRIHDVAADTSEFGMLVADADQRGIGIGRDLVEFAERQSRERGLRAMQLELLVPRELATSEQGVPQGLVRPPGLPADWRWQLRGRPPAPRALPCHRVRPHRLREAAGVGNRLEADQVRRRAMPRVTPRKSTTSGASATTRR